MVTSPIPKKYLPGQHSPLLDETRGQITAHIHPELKDECMHIDEIYSNKNTGTIVYMTEVGKPNTPHHVRWYTVATPQGFKTTPPAIIGDLSDKFGYLPFKRVLEFATSVMILVGDNDDKDQSTEFVAQHELHPYKK